MELPYKEPNLSGDFIGSHHLEIQRKSPATMMEVATMMDLVPPRQRHRGRAALTSRRQADQRTVRKRLLPEDMLRTARSRRDRAPSATFQARQGDPGGYERSRIPSRSQQLSTRKRDREDVKDKDDMECDARTEHRTGFRHRDSI